MANCCDPRAPRVFQIQVGDGLVGISGLAAVYELSKVISSFNDRMGHIF